nr:MAG TPA: hypothetical protein [Caudoviricetes sp.]
MLGSGHFQRCGPSRCPAGFMRCSGSRRRKCPDHRGCQSRPSARRCDKQRSTGHNRWLS